MRMSIWLVFVGLVGVFILGGCRPATFVQTMEPTWATVEVRKDMVDKKAWSSVVDLLVRRFDLEAVFKDAGYIRTTWLYTWTGKLTEGYRVRATVKFRNDGTTVDMKSEAQYRTKGTPWVLGTDTELLRTLKTDIMGAVSRTTR